MASRRTFVNQQHPSLMAWMGGVLTGRRSDEINESGMNSSRLRGFVVAFCLQ
jgi:hypothetical protein